MSGARSSSATATTGIADPHAVPTGRFAPSPTGALHFGSLVAALGSHLDARARGGRWLVRLEDLDPPRERPGAGDRILRSLERLGLEWDGPVWRQSRRSEHYEAALDRLRDAGSIRFCACSRSLLKTLPQNVARASGDELYHPEQCVSGHVGQFGSSGLRFRVPHGPIAFDDRSLGRRVADVASEVGDFVLKRRDGLYAYQLAVVIDDAAQGVTDVVRGSDLLSSTARQMLLQRALGLPALTYLHLPLAVGADGTKLSKSGDAPAFVDAAGRALWRALAWLGQRPPRELQAATAAEVLRWGVAHWQPRGFAGVVSRRATIAGTA